MSWPWDGLYYKNNQTNGGKHYTRITQRRSQRLRSKSRSHSEQRYERIECQLPSSNFKRNTFCLACIGNGCTSYRMV
nr:hypothetical protein Iba_chr06dCG6410 [Ipomoea batatas]